MYRTQLIKSIYAYLAIYISIYYLLFICKSLLVLPCANVMERRGGNFKEIPLNTFQLHSHHQRNKSPHKLSIK
jgi:hypothetical protein